MLNKNELINILSSGNVDIEDIFKISKENFDNEELELFLLNENLFSIINDELKNDCDINHLVYFSRNVRNNKYNKKSL